MRRYLGPAAWALIVPVLTTPYAYGLLTQGTTQGLLQGVAVVVVSHAATLGIGLAAGRAHARADAAVSSRPGPGREVVSFQPVPLYAVPDPDPAPVSDPASAPDGAGVLARLRRPS
jgi:hypothetical protein